MVSILSVPIRTVPLKPLNPLNRLIAIFVEWYIGSQNPLIYLIGNMSSAIDLYASQPGLTHTPALGFSKTPEQDKTAVNYDADLTRLWSRANSRDRNRNSLDGGRSTHRSG